MYFEQIKQKESRERDQEKEKREIKEELQKEKTCRKRGPNVTYNKVNGSLTSINFRHFLSISKRAPDRYSDRDTHTQRERENTERDEQT